MESQNNNESVKLNPQQQQILDGLSKIGDEIAGFYLDGIKLINNRYFITSSYLLGHISREIDGGIRDIFSIKEDLILCTTCKNSIRNATDSHLNSILSALNISEASDFAIKWKKIASQFHKFAHRSGAYKKPRMNDEIIALWASYEEVLYRLVGNYFSLLDRVERLLKVEEPNKGQISTVINLTSDKSIENDFFKKLASGSWFIPLRKEGVFEANKVPDIEWVEGGYKYIFWAPLYYFETLSKQIANGKNHELTSELLNIIEDVSVLKWQEGLPQNSIIWDSFVKIIINLPKDLVPIKIFDFLPFWISGSKGFSSLSHDLVRELLPKYLNEKPTDEDIEKAQKILCAILKFEIPKPDSQINTIDEEPTWFPSEPKNIVDLYFLDEALKSNPISERLGEAGAINMLHHLVLELIHCLACSKQGSTLEWKDEKSIYELRYELAYPCLNFFYQQKFFEDLESKNNNEIFVYSHDLNQNDTMVASVRSALSEKGVQVNFNKFNDLLEERLAYLPQDFSTIWFRYIGESPDNFSGSHKATYVEMLRDITNAYVLAHSEEGKKFIGQLLNEPFPIFKRVAIFLIAENYDSLSEVFWNLEEEKISKLFNTHNIERELFHFLSKNALKFAKNQLDFFAKVINIGATKKSMEVDPGYPDYWMNRWYSALKNTTQFKEQYEELSIKIGWTDDKYLNEGKIEQVNIDKPMPFTEQEFDEMSNEDISQYLINFQPVQYYAEPSIQSLGVYLQNSIIRNPAKYLENLTPFLSLSFGYVHWMIMGFQNAWRNRSFADWSLLLDFLFSYVSNPEFNEKEGDIINGKREWVSGEIGNLISDGVQDDSHAFEEALMPVAKTILLKLIKEIRLYGDKGISGRYVDRLLNTASGKLLLCLLNLSLRKARLLEFPEGDRSSKWTDDLRIVFEEVMEINEINSFILFGFRTENFFFLDWNWTVKQLEKMHADTNEMWDAFFYSHLFRQDNVASYSYPFFRQHYFRVLDNLKTHNAMGSSLAIHVGSIYLIGLEELEDDSLVTEFLKVADAEAIETFVRFYWSEKRRIIAFSFENNYIERIITLWKHIIVIAELREAEAKAKIIGSTIYLVEFVTELDSNVVDLLLSAASQDNQHIRTSVIYEELNRLKNGREDNVVYGEYIGNVMNSLVGENYTPNYKESDIKDIVEYLYQFGSKNATVYDLAERFTNRSRLEFLKPIRDKYMLK